MRGGVVGRSALDERRLRIRSCSSSARPGQRARDGGVAAGRGPRPDGMEGATGAPTFAATSPGDHSSAEPREERGRLDLIPCHRSEPHSLPPVTSKDTPRVTVDESNFAGWFKFEHLGTILAATIFARPQHRARRHLGSIAVTSQPSPWAWPLRISSAQWPRRRAPGPSRPPARASAEQVGAKRRAFMAPSTAPGWAASGPDHQSCRTPTKRLGVPRISASRSGPSELRAGEGQT